jgi:Flp pilus assembly protein TadB
MRHSGQINAVVVSVAGLFVMIVIGIVASTLIPRAVDLNSEKKSIEIQPPSSSYYTKDELDRAERELQAKVKRHMEEEKKKPTRVILLEDRSVGIPFSWIPWIFVPAVAKVRTIKDTRFILLMLAPLIAIFFEVIYPLEFLFSLLASLIGNLLTQYFLKYKTSRLEVGRPEK